MLEKLKARARVERGGVRRLYRIEGPAHAVVRKGADLFGCCSHL